MSECKAAEIKGEGNSQLTCLKEQMLLSKQGPEQNSHLQAAVTSRYDKSENLADS